jgi:hypothetical protein
VRACVRCVSCVMQDAASANRTLKGHGTRNNESRRFSGLVSVPAVWQAEIRLRKKERGVTKPGREASGTVIVRACELVGYVPYQLTTRFGDGARGVEDHPRV